jgi:GalNAc5-diNAcBac-PP-undecaprenol beta-1,3-glucosyltransferase
VLATVLIPTHSHGPLLRLAAATALTQTVTDLEIFIVLDGADAATSQVAREIAASDTRVRLFDYPKGQRHGEAHRHLALEAARGEIVCYLSDDDLWFPDHVEYMAGLLSGADFANSMVAAIQPDESMENLFGDIGRPSVRRRLVEDAASNFIGLCNAGHSLAAYRSMSGGWQPAPPDIPTDLFMWRRFLANPSISATSGGRPTALHFAAARRREASPAERLEELTRWSRRLADPVWRNEFRMGVFEFIREQRAEELERLEVEQVRLQKALEVTASDWASAQAAMAELAEENARLFGLLEQSAGHWHEAQATIAALDEERARLSAVLIEADRRAAAAGSHPFIGRLRRLAARVRARQGDR